MPEQYFVGVLAGGASWGALSWTLTLSISYLLVMIFGPWVGAQADARGAKKAGLAWATVGCTVCTGLLATTGPGGLLWAAALIILSNLCYALGENLCAGFLPELAQGRDIARVSAFGWSIGYFGGLLALAISLGLIFSLKSRGFAPQVFIGASMVAVALLYALAAIPLFVWVRERTPPTGKATTIASIFQENVRSVRALRHFPDLRRFMISAVFGQAGVAVVITLAAVYAEAALGFTQEDTIKMLLVVNITAAAGAFGFGQLQDRFGHKDVLLAVFGIWIVAVAVLTLKADKVGFWIAANLAGVALGACQSGGRALVGFLAPPDRVAETYGVWGLFTRASAILGPMTYGVIAWATSGNHRLAMLLTGVFLWCALRYCLASTCREGVLWYTQNRSIHFSASFIGY